MALGRILFGGVAGGIAGSAMSDANTSTGKFQSAILGAAAGMGLGVGITKQFWQGIGGMARGGLRLRQTFRAAGAARRMGAGPIEALSFGRYTARNTSLPKQTLGTLWGGAKGAYGIGRSGLRGAASVAGFALRRPRTTIALGAAGLGAYGLAQMGGSGQSGMDADEAAAIAHVHGGPSTGFAPGMGTNARQDQRAMFMDSTFGLTQGLHRGRHR